MLNLFQHLAITQIPKQVRNDSLKGENMKALSINPFYLKPQVKRIQRLLRKPKHVEIPDFVYNNLLDKNLNSKRNYDLQQALDYMAANYKIHFGFERLGYDVGCSITCSKGTKSSNVDLYCHDEDAELASKIYKAASSVL